MKELFKDITQGLVSQGWKIHGGNDETFLILSKNDDQIKVYVNNRYGNPNHFIVRYSYKADEERKA